MKNLYFALTFVFSMVFSTTNAQGSGNLLELDGISSYVSCGNINLSTTSITMMAWIKVDAFKPNHPFITSICGIEDRGGQAMFRIGDAGLAAEKLQFILQINGTPRKLNGVTSLSAGKWYHVAATYDGSNMRIYIDGVQDASMSQTGTITANSTFYIGRNYDNNRVLDGQIDEVSVWKAALSQATIRNYMCKKVNSLHPNFSSLEGYWKMDNATGSSVTDHSGNSHTGSFIGTPIRKLSGAPIGDVSVHNYGSPSSIYLAHPDGDSLHLSNISNNPSAVHLYRVNTAPSSKTLPTNFSSYDTSRYWGIHYVGGSNPRSTVDYYYTKNNFYKSNGSCFIGLVRRRDNSRTSWSVTNGTQSSSKLSLLAQTATELMLAFKTNLSIHQDTAKGICQGDSVLLSNQTSGANFQWYKDGIALTNDTTNSLQAKVAGTYYLSIDFSGCKDTSRSFVLSVGQKPTVTASSFGEVCDDGKLATITGGSPTGGRYIGPHMSGSSFVTSNAGPGTHKIIYYYKAPNGCADTASNTITVHPLPFVNLPSFATICEDSSSFTLNTGIPAGGIYKVNGTTTTSFDAASFGVGTHVVKYEFTDTNRCSNVDSEAVVVVALPNVTFNLPRNSVCEGTDPFPINGANPTGGAFSGNGVTGFNFAPKVSGVGSHEVTYAYRDRGTGCSNSAKDTVYVRALPAAPTISRNGRELVSSKGDNYQWYDKDGLIVGETGQKFVPIKSGLYSVAITVAGCTSNNSTEFDFDKTLGVLSGTQHSFALYPNPVESTITLSGTNVERIRIIDMAGKTVLNQVISAERTTVLDLIDLDQGTYVVEIEFSNKDIAREKLIKR